MPDNAAPKTKRQNLQATGTFNPRAAQVRHPLFQQSDFFDPEDLLQVKYESLRATEKDDYPLARAAQEFGLSRPTLYQAQKQFAQEGLGGLVPRKRGPRNPHKLTPKIRQHLLKLAALEPKPDALEMARRLRQRFKVKLHPRTLEKALSSQPKRGRQTPT